MCKEYLKINPNVWFWEALITLGKWRLNGKIKVKRSPGDGSQIEQLSDEDFKAFARWFKKNNPIGQQPSDHIRRRIIYDGSKFSTKPQIDDATYIKYLIRFLTKAYELNYESQLMKHFTTDTQFTSQAFKELFAAIHQQSPRQKPALSKKRKHASKHDETEAKRIHHDHNSSQGATSTASLEADPISTEVPPKAPVKYAPQHTEFGVPGYSPHGQWGKGYNDGYYGRDQYGQYYNNAQWGSEGYDQYGQPYYNAQWGSEGYDQYGQPYYNAQWGSEGYDQYSQPYYNAQWGGEGYDQYSQPYNDGQSSSEGYSRTQITPSFQTQDTVQPPAKLPPSPAYLGEEKVVNRILPGRANSIWAPRIPQPPNLLAQFKQTTTRFAPNNPPATATDKSYLALGPER